MAKLTKSSEVTAAEERNTPTEATEAPKKDNTPYDNTVYSVDEFAAAAGVLEANADIVRAAFRVAGLKEATFKDAKNLVDTFKKTEVKR